MKRLLLALLAIQNLAHAGVIMVDESIKIKTPASGGQGVSTEMVLPVLVDTSLNVDRSVKTVDVQSATLVVVPPAIQTWQLTIGRTVGKELHEWSEKAGWHVVWNLPKDWSVPSTTTFSGDFKTAASEVISTLATNGALVRAQFYDGNKTMVVTGPGVTPQ